MADGALDDSQPQIQPRAFSSCHFVGWRVVYGVEIHQNYKNKNSHRSNGWLRMHESAIQDGGRCYWRVVDGVEIHRAIVGEVVEDIIRRGSSGTAPVLRTHNGT